MGKFGGRKEGVIESGKKFGQEIGELERCN
jgi:hypothetical protein